jgi:hypothetical protein
MSTRLLISCLGKATKLLIQAMKMKSFKVFDFTGHGAIAIEHGQTVYRAIHYHLLRNELVQLDFTGVEFLTTAFVGFAFGQLLKDIPQEKVNGLIEFTGLSDDKRDMIQRVMNRAYKWYFDEQNQA